jgi:sugar lactone lactonase YvrE
MNQKLVTFFVAFILLFSFAYSQDEPKIERLDPIPVPEPNVNSESGIGNMLTDVDFDGDGLTDVFVVSHNWGDGDFEMTPRLYKYEQVDGVWTITWACSLKTGLDKQNTWPALAHGDLDGDGLQEIIWGPVNWATDANPNPDRIVVFEEVEATGNDELGVKDGDNYLPNTSFSISSADNANLRPFKFIVEDVDFDDTTEVVFCDRVANWYVGVLSVSDVPDAGVAGGSEVWKVEAGMDNEFGISAENKWDIAYMDSTIYLFDEVQCDRIKWDGEKWNLLSPQPSVLEGAGAWKSAVVADVDNNAKDEIIVGTWYTSVVGGHGIYVLSNWNADGTTLEDSLVATKVVDLSEWMPDGTYGVYGGALGDFDGNGKKDFVFGSRGTTPNALIFRAEYNGAANGAADPANWTVAVIDSKYVDEGGRWGVVGMANLDTDIDKEVLYTSSVPAGGDLFTDPETQPIVVLDYVKPIIAGPYVWRDAIFTYDADVIPAGGGYHGVTVDKYNRIWTARWATGAECLTAAGDTVFLVDSANVKTATGTDTTLFLTNIRGLNVDKDGNIIASKSGFVVKLSVEDGSALAWTPLAGSPLKPAIDDEGYIYVGLVVGTTPISVIDPAEFKVTQTIDLPRPASYARGAAVSADGTVLIPGDLTGEIHSLPVYTTSDFVNYAITDSIFNDSQGNPILINQSVTVDRDAKGRFWISQDGAYGGAGDPRNAENAMIMVDMEANQYTSVPMPEPRTDVNGPRGAAWTSSGDTMYVASWNAGRLYRYVADVTSVASTSSVPQQFNLSQNYPNPFNPVTFIEFNLAQAGKTSLTIYNILGQRVVTLFDQDMVAGKHKIQFNAEKFASGTYIYELKSSGKVLNKKMTLLK